MRRERPARPFARLHPVEQVVSLDEGELWDTLASQWCRPGEESIDEFAATWEGDDLAAVAFHLGLEVQPRNGRRDYWQRAMRRTITDAVRAYAAEHPGLFEPDPEEEASQSHSAGARAHHRESDEPVAH